MLYVVGDVVRVAAYVFKKAYIWHGATHVIFNLHKLQQHAVKRSYDGLSSVVLSTALQQ
jgi:hypothetical protein